MDFRKVIELLKLEPLPQEGGYFRRTYESAGMIPSGLLSAYEGERFFSTAIYYLVTPDSFSALHRLPQDELFHFYLGDPVEMVQISPSGNAKRIVLGPDILNGQELQTLAPGGVWQGTRLLANGTWALLGTTVTPGFDWRDFERGTRENLRKRFPQHGDLIEAFTHD
jgi:hypothetical protein